MNLKYFHSSGHFLMNFDWAIAKIYLPPIKGHVSVIDVSDDIEFSRKISKA